MIAQRSFKKNKTIHRRKISSVFALLILLLYTNLVQAFIAAMVCYITCDTCACIYKQFTIYYNLYNHAHAIPFSHLDKNICVKAKKNKTNIVFFVALIDSSNLKRVPDDISDPVVDVWKDKFRVGRRLAYFAEAVRI